MTSFLVEQQTRTVQTDVDYQIDGVTCSECGEGLEFLIEDGPYDGVEIFVLACKHAVTAQEDKVDAEQACGRN